MKNKKEKISLRWSYLLGLIITISIGAIQWGYLFVYFNTANDVIAARYGWDGEKQTHMIALITTMVPLGSMFGSIIGGSFISIGRLKFNYLINFVLLIGSGLTLIENIECLIIGRIIEGLCAGAYTALIPVYIREVTPVKVYGLVSGINPTFMAVGNFISFNVGFGLPDASAADSSNFWRIMFGLPILLVVIQTFCLLIFYNYETPKFLLSKSENDKCLKFLKLIYKKKEDSEQELLRLQQLSNTQRHDVTWKQLFSPNYKRALLVACLTNTIQRWCGIYAIMFYSKDIFQQGGKSSSSAILGTSIMGFFNVAGGVVYCLIVDRVGRRPLWIYGALSHSLVFSALSLSCCFDLQLLTEVLIILAVFLYSISIGVVNWTYVGEIVPAKGVSFAVFLNAVESIILSFAAKEMIDSSIHVYGTFLIFSFINAIGYLLFLPFVPETKGKSEEQIRILFNSHQNQSKEEISLLAE